MSPIPGPGEAASGGARSSRQSARTSARERGAAAGSSSPPPSSVANPPRTSARYTTLQVKLARMYMMFGTMIRPFGRFYPFLTPIGDNLKSFSDEAAQAWIELAQEDKKVLDMLESMTKASTWGNVIGIHFAIFASSIPGGGGEYISQVTDVPSDDPISVLRSMGLSDEEIAGAQALAAQMQGATHTPARDQSSGGPGDTVRVPPPLEFQPEGEAGMSAAPPPIQSTVPQSKAAIVTPQELGVQQPADFGVFPHSGAPNGSGGVL